MDQATQEALHALSPTELLARHREVAGPDTLQELLDTVRRCSHRPTTCRVVLNGPDTLAISESQPAQDFLQQALGLVPDGDPRFPTLALPRPCSPEDPEWRQFLDRARDAAADLEWALVADTQALRVRFHSVRWAEPPHGSYRATLRLRWLHGGERQEEVHRPGTWHAADATDVLEAFQSRCPGLCSVSVHLYRRRALMDKLCATAAVDYDGNGVFRASLPLLRPEDGAPRGTAIVELDSIRHRYAVLEAAAAVERQRRSVTAGRSESTSAPTTPLDPPAPEPPVVESGPGEALPTPFHLASPSAAIASAARHTRSPCSPSLAPPDPLDAPDVAVASPAPRDPAGAADSQPVTQPEGLEATGDGAEAVEAADVEEAACSVAPLPALLHEEEAPGFHGTGRGPSHRHRRRGQEEDDDGVAYEGGA